MASPDEGFWAWALQAYARPGVAEACLALQDEFGQCTPYLLWAAWRAAAGRGLDPVALAAGAALSARWEAAATGPLRAARRALSVAMPGMADAARLSLRAEVKALELRSEHLLMQVLDALPSATDGAADLSAALAAAANAWPVPATEPALARLVQTLS